MRERFSFQCFGLGAPIVLLHSFGPGHDSEEWRPASELLARSFRVYAPDLLGWGRSDKPAITYDGELYIQLLVDFLGSVVSERCVLVAAGLSGSLRGPGSGRPSGTGEPSGPRGAIRHARSPR